ncbi:MAG TPA: NosD domain-containing protein [Acidimicrobiales bacterium]|jgi:parallel beta-helix repeat protein|nr:NosD domain-containing protein [Acidimicrobiales bacterium]
MSRLRKSVGVLATLAFVTSLFVLAPTPAQARHVNCGEITENTTLTTDFLNCEGYGLVILEDNITVDLNGHTVSCNNTFPEQVGILLFEVTGVTVQNGTVEGCDAGVAIEGGGNNTVRRMIARNNVNDMEEPFAPTGPPPPGSTLADILCNYGDGIAVNESSNNLIERNWVYGNGPYSGISLIEEGSDGNIVRNNRVEDNNLTNLRPQNPEQNSLCGATLPGTPGMQRGRTVQNIGIRIEGPGADNNRVTSNQVTNNALVGISIHSYVCNAQPGDPRGDSNPNLHNRIDRNHVSGTGNETVELDAFADGIGLLAQGPIGNVTCGSDQNTVSHNVSVDNRRHGISVNRHNDENTILRNMANDNDVDGITVAANAPTEAGPDPFGASDNTLRENRAANNGRFDGSDFNPNCDNNAWINNIFITVNQECVDPDASVVVPAAAAASAAAAGDDLSGMTRSPSS